MDRAPHDRCNTRILRDNRSPIARAQLADSAVTILALLSPRCRATEEPPRVQWKQAATADHYRQHPPGPGRAAGWQVVRAMRDRPWRIRGRGRRSRSEEHTSE